MSFEIIDNLSQIKVDFEELTFDDVRPMFGTGRSELISDKNSFEKKYAYRNGVMTKIGDIENLFGAN